MVKVWRSTPCSSCTPRHNVSHNVSRYTRHTARPHTQTHCIYRGAFGSSAVYLAQELLPQPVESLRVEAQEHDQGGGRAGSGLVAPKQKLRGRLLDGLGGDGT